MHLFYVTHTHTQSLLFPFHLSFLVSFCLDIFLFFSNKALTPQAVDLTSTSQGIVESESVSLLPHRHSDVEICRRWVLYVRWFYCRVQTRWKRSNHLNFRKQGRKREMLDFDLLFHFFSFLLEYAYGENESYFENVDCAKAQFWDALLPYQSRAGKSSNILCIKFPEHSSIIWCTDTHIHSSHQSEWLSVYSYTDHTLIHCSPQWPGSATTIRKQSNIYISNHFVSPNWALVSLEGGSFFY